jgi:hypothetical protein
MSVSVFSASALHRRPWAVDLRLEIEDVLQLRAAMLADIAERKSPTSIR